jgi:hypothetical protein
VISRPSDRICRAANTFANGTGPRKATSETVVAMSIAPERSTTLASAVGPSSHGVENTK